MAPLYLWLRADVRGPGRGHRGQPLGARRDRAARHGNRGLMRAPEVLRACLQSSRACELTAHHYLALLAALPQQMDSPMQELSVLIHKAQVQ